MRLLLCLIASLLACTTPAPRPEQTTPAWANVMVFLVDTTTGLPVNGAEVNIEGAGVLRQSVTDSNGVARVGGLPPGVSIIVRTRAFTMREATVSVQLQPGTVHTLRLRTRPTDGFYRTPAEVAAHCGRSRVERAQIYAGLLAHLDSLAQASWALGARAAYDPRLFARSPDTTDYHLTAVDTLQRDLLEGLVTREVLEGACLAHDEKDTRCDGDTRTTRAVLSVVLARGDTVEVTVLLSRPSWFAEWEVLLLQRGGRWRVIRKTPGMIT